eukprot:GHUV01051357.1.p2 GENE.GHUV01051357.1~~GHUV01051357.1.p2  ORF type:complete len:124 (+),score=21.30 GHUV01051357.1:407-778(+)
MEELLKALSKDILEHLVHVLKAAPRPLKHPVLAALVEDPVRPPPKMGTGVNSVSGGRATVGYTSVSGSIGMFDTESGDSDVVLLLKCPTERLPGALGTCVKHSTKATPAPSLSINAPTPNTGG